MFIKHLRTILPGSESLGRICATAWSPNNQKLAIATSDRVITVFDETGEKKDRFATKCADSAKTKNYSILALCFSPDSTRLAVLQSDCSVFVYKLGLEWGEKKSICNKFIQNCDILCMGWPSNQPNALIFGTSDGKIRLGNCKTNKAATLFQAESAVVGLSCNVEGTAIASAHLDGSIYRFYFQDDEAEATQGKLCNCPSVPCHIVWAQDLMVAGNDGNLYVYNKDGKQVQKISSSTAQMPDFEISSTATNTNGQTVILGGFNAYRVLNYNSSIKRWEESAGKTIENLYSITCFGWKPDGSRLIIVPLCSVLLQGNSTGRAEMFDCCIKRVRYRGKFEIVYTSSSQVIVKRISTGSRVVLKSNYGYTITKLDIFRDQFLVAHTDQTLLIGDMATCKLSEMLWKSSENEKFFFDIDKICMVFNAGELSILEYGVNEVIGTCRTEFTNPHLVRYLTYNFNDSSIRIEDSNNNKTIAYLVDKQTIQVVNLVSGHVIATIPHDHKIDWLELSLTAEKILFRDKKYQLHLYDLKTQTRVTLCNYCSYVQWVPESDVVVAQNRSNLLVWYFIEAPEKVMTIPIKGDVETIERANGETNVLVTEGMNTCVYKLDQVLIEFGASFEQKDYARAISLLERLQWSEQVETMWKKLGRLALDDGNLIMAERCFAETGDISSARFLRPTLSFLDEAHFSGNGTADDINTKIKIAILHNQYKEAENLYLRYGQVEEAMNMYQDIHKWDMSIRVAELKNHPDLVQIKESYHAWLLSSGQEEKLGKIKEQEGNYDEAVSVYLKGGIPGRAAQVLIKKSLYQDRKELTERVAVALVKSGLYENAGELYELIGQDQKSLEAYKKGRSYRQAIAISRAIAPDQVTLLEEEWGDYLVSQKKDEQATNHYIEAGKPLKALKAAINGKLFTKADSIISSLSSLKEAQVYFEPMAKYFESAQKYELAERYYMLVNKPRNVVEMYLSAKMWDRAYSVAQTSVGGEQMLLLFTKAAQDLVTQGNLKDAEVLFVAIKEPDMAITMYKNQKRYNDMLRLVSQYHADLLDDTYLLIAKTLENEGSWKMAETYYLSAKDWKSAVNMYCANENFEDAYRVAKSHGGAAPATQVAYIWAKQIKGEAAVKMLNRLELLDQVLELAADSSTSLDFINGLLPYLDAQKISQIHLKQAQFLEDEGKYQEAEEAYIKANKAREAILMYYHNEQWEKALEIAEKHEPQAIGEVLVGHAMMCFNRRDYDKMESLLLRSPKPEFAIKLYKDAGMWKEAIQFAERHVPNRVSEIQAEMQKQASGFGTSENNIQDLYSTARKYEFQRNYEKAIETYLALQPQSDNADLAMQGWLKAVDVAGKFLSSEEAQQVVVQVIRKLVTIEKYELAGDLLSGLGMPEEAVETYIRGTCWEKARKICATSTYQLKDKVESAYIAHLKRKGDTDEVARADVNAGLDLYYKKGDWDKCLLIAQKEGREKLVKYLGLCLSEGFKKSEWTRVGEYLVQYGTADQSLYSFYERFVAYALNSGDDMIASLARDALFKLSKETELNDRVFSKSSRFLQALHLLVLSRKLAADRDLSLLSARIAMSLTTFSDVYNADVAFYQAGKHCQAVGWDSKAFAFWNYFLDICESIQDSDGSILETSDFAAAGLSVGSHLPNKTSVTEAEREKVRDWVLQVSLEKNIRPEIETRKCSGCATTLFAPLLECSSCHVASDFSWISGYPINGAKMTCHNCPVKAGKAEWNEYVIAFKTCPLCATEQAVNFN